MAAVGREDRIPNGGKTIAVGVRKASKVRFTKHALLRMFQRDVTENQVIEVLRNPTIKSGLPVETAGAKRFRGAASVSQFVDVVFDERADTIRVITVMVIEKPKKSRK